MRLANRPYLVIALLLSLAGCLGADPRASAQSPADPPSATAEPARDVASLHVLEVRIKNAAAKALPAVVGIRIGGASGSGVIVSEDGIVMTAGHVVGKPGQAVSFFFADGKIAKGITLGVHLLADAGLAKIIDRRQMALCREGPSDSVKLGSWCLAIGHPLGYQKGRPPVVRVGRVL